ncbi:MAG: T9SS type A sorting domain-containing protein [Flavobacteriaceae bacterium]|nr:T9SS type A sorting domain-containing protein [Flavobacteriaceae bacterium]
MKYIMVLFCFAFSLNSYSQAEELFYNDWRLYSLNIDGQNYTPPSNEEISNVILSFNSDPENLITGVCSSFEGELVYNNTDVTFAFPNGISTTLIECENPDNSTFEVLYFNFFNDYIDFPFPYIVGHVDFPEWWYLIIYNENGDSAEYEWYTLSTQDSFSVNFTLFPNPITNEFFISIDNTSEKVNVTIYNILGEIILTEKNYQSNTSVDVQNLNSGIYFVSITDENGNTSIKRLIKK